uniref:Transmembrane protein n=1 Tax=Acrobeloides nanus TaxID=290746 RepID=A0A914E380_9BILA
MIFLIYWQYRDFHTGLLDNISEFNQKYDNVKITRYNRIIFGGAILALTGCVFCGTVSIVLANDEEHYERDMIKAQQIFRVSFSPLLSLLVTCYGFLVWFVVLTYYAVVTNVLSGGLEQFNQIINMKLQRANENNIEKIITENYMTHLKIIENVHMVNNVFEVIFYSSYMGSQKSFSHLKNFQSTDVSISGSKVAKVGKGPPMR